MKRRVVAATFGLIVVMGGGACSASDEPTAASSGTDLTIGTTTSPSASAPATVAPITTTTTSAAGSTKTTTPAGPHPVPPPPPPPARPDRTQACATLEQAAWNLLEAVSTVNDAFNAEGATPESKAAATEQFATDVRRVRNLVQQSAGQTNDVQVQGATAQLSLALGTVINAAPGGAPAIDSAMSSSQFEAASNGVEQACA